MIRKKIGKNPRILTVFERDRVYRDDRSEKFKRDTLRIISSIGPVNPRIVQFYGKHELSLNDQTEICTHTAFTKYRTKTLFAS